MPTNGLCATHVTADESFISTLVFNQVTMIRTNRRGARAGTRRLDIKRLTMPLGDKTTKVQRMLTLAKLMLGTIEKVLSRWASCSFSHSLPEPRKTKRLFMNATAFSTQSDCRSLSPYYASVPMCSSASSNKSAKAPGCKRGADRAGYVSRAVAGFASLILTVTKLFNAELVTNVSVAFTSAGPLVYQWRTECTGTFVQFYDCRPRCV
jgi:hypothetical protein